MRKLLTTILLSMSAATAVMADGVQMSTTLPTLGTPEYAYPMWNGNKVYVNANTAPTRTEANYGQFAFYSVPEKEGHCYIYSITASKWLTYTPAESYSNCKNFVQMSEEKNDNAYFKLTPVGGGYNIQPVTTAGEPEKYLNWYEGLNGNPLDGGNTLGLWQQNGKQDAGSKWIMIEPVVPEPLLVLGEYVLTGTEPVRVEDDLAANVLSQEEITIAIDVTAQDDNFERAILGSYNSKAESPLAKESYFTVFLSNSECPGVRYADTQWCFTSKKSMTTNRTKLVIVTKPSACYYAYYVDGNLNNETTWTSTVPSIGTINATDLYLGGLNRSDNPNKFPFTGTIHSVQFFPGALNSDQIALIDYTNPIPTAVKEVRVQPVVSDKEYDLTGRPATQKSGIVVKQGKKYLK